MGWILAKEPRRILDKSRPGRSDITWEIVESEELGQISRMIRRCRRGVLDELTQQDSC